MSNDLINHWDQKAKEWRKWTGTQGDFNRRYISDPVLWKFIGNVQNLTVLDAGCGTGYLSVLLNQKGANVIGIDISPEMINEARESIKSKEVDISFRTDSSSTLDTVSDKSIDIIVSNYVLMDLPDLIGALKSFNRALKTNGKVVVVMGHPCFDKSVKPDNFSYFTEQKLEEAWGPFKSSFIYFHRPLSTYWKTFKNTGFKVDDFEEPVLQEPRPKEVDVEAFEKYSNLPLSIAFLLKKDQ